MHLGLGLYDRSSVISITNLRNGMGSTYGISAMLLTLTSGLAFILRLRALLAG